MRVFPSVHAIVRKTWLISEGRHWRSDDETFLSADDLRINLWNLAVTDQSFNIVDIKPDNMEELTEVRGGRPCALEMTSTLFAASCTCSRRCSH